MLKRIIGLGIGLAYGFSLGFFLILLTGGGHGNFVPIVYFLLTSLFGLLYPTLGFLVVDLRSLFMKSVFVAIFLIHIFLVVIFFNGDFISANTSPRDTISLDPLLILILEGPQFICLALFVREIVRYGIRRDD